jgi:trans-aconitate methyltransferase
VAVVEDGHSFDKDYWREHWQGAQGPGLPPNPHLVAEVAGLTPGTAVEAGCGEGAEAIWLAQQGWRVTAVDISPEALERAAARAGDVDVEWVEADLTTWAPAAPVDLVTTHYAHPAMPQLAFYRRISEWVRVGGTLLVVGHLHDAHGHEAPSAQVTVDSVRALLDEAGWRLESAQEQLRTVPGRETPLRDVVVRATRLR